CVLGGGHPFILGTNPAITSAHPTRQHCFANGLTPLAYTHEEVCYGKSQRATPRHSDDSPFGSDSGSGRPTGARRSTANLGLARRPAGPLRAALQRSGPPQHLLETTRAHHLHPHSGTGRKR